MLIKIDSLKFYYFTRVAATYNSQRLNKTQNYNIWMISTLGTTILR